MSNKFSNNLKQKLKMKQLKIKSFLALLWLIMFANILAMGQPLCPPVSYLTATVNPDRSVTLNWTNPPQSQWGGNIAYFRCTVGGTSYNQYFDYFNYTQSGTHTIPASVFPNGGTFTISLFNGFMDGGQQDVCEGVINSVQVTIPTPPTVNMNRYITLTVQQNADISLWLCSDTNNTPARIVSGNLDTIVSLNACYSYITLNLRSGATTMTLYGNINLLYSMSNENRLTAVDVSHNDSLMYLDLFDNKISTLNISNLTLLEELNIGLNNFTSAGLDSIYCQLPDRTGLSQGMICVHWQQSSDHTLYTATNSQNATSKNWRFTYALGGGDYPQSNGTYVCGTTPITTPSVTTNPAEDITQNSAKFYGDVTPGTNVIAERGFEWKETNGGTYTDLVAPQTGNYFSSTLSGLTANTDYTFRAYVKVGTTKTYGSELSFTTLDIPVVNTDKWIELTVEQGEMIHMTFFVINNNTPIKIESGSWDTIINANNIQKYYVRTYAHSTSIKIYGDITKFACYENETNITGLDVSHNTGLIKLECDYNNLSSLDLTGLTALENLICNHNNLSSIKTSGCISLKKILCYKNNLSACGLDSLFHQLPRRAANDKGGIIISYSPNANPGSSTCRDTIATNRNWEVLNQNTPIANTSYDCLYFTMGIEEVITDNISAKVYPNPVSNDLNIECGEKIESLDIYDALGRKIISKENTPKSTTIDVSNLDNGIYILKLRTAKGSGEYKIVVND